MTYIHIYKSASGTGFHAYESALLWEDDWTGALLKTYVLNQETGELTEYKEPERLFVWVSTFDKRLTLPQTAQRYEFRSGKDQVYYEKMPNGDFRLLSEDEKAELRGEK